MLENNQRIVAGALTNAQGVVPYGTLHCLHMNEQQRNIILIGGAPTTGKTVMAERVARQLAIPWISADQIRNVMSAVVREEDYPQLFQFDSYTAEEFLKEHTADEAAAMEMKRAEAVWDGVVAFIEDTFAWPNGFVLEGAYILPHLVHKSFHNRPDIKAVFLVDEDVDRAREVVFERDGLWDENESPSDEVKEKEVKWVRLFSHKLKAEVSKYGYPWIEVSKEDKDLPTVLKALGV